ncbi:hypothetical protein, partial [Methylobacterium haplocladii]|uniref:hypothetical protein n=1 Tax=Methylobacterium haplocladii TaxID=1176176 RepID=UPI001AEE2F30
ARREGPCDPRGVGARRNGPNRGHHASFSPYFDHPADRMRTIECHANNQKEPTQPAGFYQMLWELGGDGDARVTADKQPLQISRANRCGVLPHVAEKIPFSEGLIDGAWKPSISQVRTSRHTDAAPQRSQKVQRFRVDAATDAAVAKGLRKIRSLVPAISVAPIRVDPLPDEWSR